MWVRRAPMLPRARPAAARTAVERVHRRPALHVGIEHFQGPTAGIDLVVVGEIREPFEDAEQILVPRAAPDLHIAGAALRAERLEPRELVVNAAHLFDGRSVPFAIAIAVNLAHALTISLSTGRPSKRQKGVQQRPADDK